MNGVWKRFAPPILGSCLAVAACHPTGADSINDYSTVVTAHDPTYNFGTARTYSLPNQVIAIGAPDAGPAQPVNPQFQQAILTSIQTQMNARGYTQVAPSATPNLITTAAMLEVTNINYYYGYYCNYWSYYYPACYPYYPPPVYVTSYTVGTVVIDLATAQPAENKFNGVWSAIIRGVSSGSTTTDATRIAGGVSQAFTQSPYVESAP